MKYMSARILLVFSLFAFALAAVAAPTVAGKWTAIVTMPNGDEVKASVDIQDDGGKLSGSIFVAETGKLPMQDMKLEGGELTFKVTNDTTTYFVKMTLKGDSLDGTFKVGNSTGTVKATR